MKKVFLIALFVFLCASPAYAYLDLGNGSSFVQYIIAGLGMIPMFFKKVFRKVKCLFCSEKEKDDDK